MTAARSIVLKTLAVLCLSIGMMPALSLAQQQGQPGGPGGGGGRGMGGMGMAQMPQQLQQVLAQLDLTPDQKTKIDGIITQAQQDGRQALQGMQDLTPEERQQKMQDLQKLMTDTKTKVEAELTPEQKAKYYPLVATTGLKRMTDLFTALKTASAKLEVGDDQKKQLKDMFDETQKSLDGLKTDADAVKDEPTATDFQKQLTKLQMDTRKQLVDILGQDDARTLMQSAQQSLRGTVRGRRGADGATGANGATGETAPATQPVAK
jgi:Spy/CpxP family protein refolding chaperone